MKRGAASGGGPSRVKVFYKRPEVMGQKAGKKAKSRDKGAKGGVGAQLEGEDGPVDQGNNKRFDHHAEKQAVARAFAASDTPPPINITQAAWPCWHCNEWLPLCAVAEGLTITIQSTTDRYIDDHPDHPGGGENTVIYHADGRVQYVRR